MRVDFLLCRIRPGRVQPNIVRHVTRRAITTRSTQPLRWPSTWRGTVSKRSILHAKVGAGTLGAAAFVALSENTQDGDDEETGERRMLEQSREEIEHKVADDERGLYRILHRLGITIDTWIIEPICTGFRFIQLVCIFVPVIVTVPAIWLGARQKDRDNERSGSLWWYNFLVKSMEYAGPAFIKLGQWAASRSDIFPTEMCDIMSKLHSHAPAHSMRATRRIIEAAFGGRAFEDIFEEFDETPLGVGAIAQVYKAKLKPDLASPQDIDISHDDSDLTQSMLRHADTVLKSSPKRVPSTFVAIKVLHPNVERTVRRDLRIMWFFASGLNIIPTMEWLSLPDEVAQFER